MALALAALFAAFRIGSHDGSADSGEPPFPKGGPAEFLYLDAGRSASYLAQINRGGYAEEKVVRKLADSLSGNVSATGIGEASATRAHEILTERVLQPTDASAFFSLMDKLESHVEEVLPREFTTVKGLDEGTFVSFKTSAIVTPIYMNAFLAVRQATTLEALFPHSKRRRERAQLFLEDVGRNPRAVFAIRPAVAGEPDNYQPISYLMPIRARSLTAERSLIKYGGGQFTVVGKMVRDFHPHHLRHIPAYIDSQTLETWEQPLRRAPRELLCRTEQQCVNELRSGEVGGEMVEKGGLTGARRRAAIDRARDRILQALRKQTTINRRGAVILPIAIYK